MASVLFCFSFKNFSLPQGHRDAVIIFSKLFCLAFSHLGLMHLKLILCVVCEVFKSLNLVRDSLGFYGTDYNLDPLLGYYLQFKSM